MSLEAPDIRTAAGEDPRGFRDQYAEGAFLDEIQRAPVWLSYLQGLSPPQSALIRAKDKKDKDKNG